jgi:hypothetical protein
VFIGMLLRAKPFRTFNPIKNTCVHPINTQRNKGSFLIIVDEVKRKRTCEGREKMAITQKI